MDISNINILDFFSLEPLAQFLISAMYVGEAFLFIFIAIIVKRKIKWGEIDPNKFAGYLWGAFFLTCIILFAADRLAPITDPKPISRLFTFLTWSWALWISAQFGCPLFNHINKDMWVLTLQKWEDIQEHVTELKFMVYKEHDLSNKLVAVRLNAQNKEPFKDLVKRILGIKKYIEIRNDAAGWTLNQSGKLYLYRKLLKSKKEPNKIVVVAEPDIKSHSVPAFVKTYEGFHSYKAEHERVKEENMNLRLQKHYLARIEGRQTVAPFIELGFPEHYKDWKERQLKVDKQDNEKIEELEKNIQEGAEKSEEELEKEYTEIESKDSLLYEEDFEDYAW